MAARRSASPQVSPVYRLKSCLMPKTQIKSFVICFSAVEQHASIVFQPKVGHCNQDAFCTCPATAFGKPIYSGFHKARQTMCLEQSILPIKLFE